MPISELGTQADKDARRWSGLTSPPSPGPSASHLDGGRFRGVPVPCVKILREAGFLSPALRRGQGEGHSCLGDSTLTPAGPVFVSVPTLSSTPHTAPRPSGMGAG